MTTKSGWCMAPPGARPKHGLCQSLACSCPCHVRINVDPRLVHAAGDHVHVLRTNEQGQWQPRDGETVRAQIPDGTRIRVRVADVTWHGRPDDDHADEFTFRLEPIPEDT